jgi:hypothetical protein
VQEEKVGSGNQININQNTLPVVAGILLVNNLPA